MAKSIDANALFQEYQRLKEENDQDSSGSDYSNLPEFFDEEDAFLPKVAIVLRQIFDRFDVNKDAVLDETELAAYFQFTNGKEDGDGFDAEMQQEIRDNFDVDNQGRLTVNGFLEMYQLQTLSDPEETLNDLKKHGFDENFDPIVQV